MKATHIVYGNKVPGLKITYSAKEKADINKLEATETDTGSAVLRLTPEKLIALKKIGCHLSPTLKKYWKVFIASKLYEVLYPFQVEGVWFTLRKRGRALIADEMGLGKTVQALCWIKAQETIPKTIIVVPAAVKYNWEKEIHKWIPEASVSVAEGTKPHKVTGDILVINYDIIPKWTRHIKAFQPDALIIDEIHYIKNSGSKRTAAVKRVGKLVDHVIGLSGTPILNRPIEIINTIRLIDKKVIPNVHRFKYRYCGPKNNGFGIQFNGASNTKELHRILAESVMIRRKKKDVLKELPDKQRTFIGVHLENQKEYEHASDNFLSYLTEHEGTEAAVRASRAEAITKINYLKRMAAEGKMKAALNWIDEFLTSGKKLVVMAVHKSIIDRLMARFPDISVKVDGSTSAAEKTKAVARFQQDPKIKLLHGNVKAAGVGLTLTAASTALFLEYPWTPGDLTQAEDRIHRITQMEKVNIYYLFGIDTIEQAIASRIDTKTKITDSVLDGEQTAKQDLFAVMMRLYKEEELI